MRKAHHLYEQVVHELLVNFAAGLEKEGAKILEEGYGPKNKLLGHSGIMHQIDVHIEYLSKDGTHRLKLVECKHLSQNKIDLATALTFYARITDIQREKGDQIIVDGNLFTTVGYTSPARKFANAYKIATNSAHLDKNQGSISFNEKVVIRAAAGKLKVSGQKADINN